jgi:hypothetical protein
MTADTVSVVVNQAPGITLSSSSVGAGLQYGSLTGSLASAPSTGAKVRIQSSNPAMVLVSADAATPGAEFIDVVPSGQTFRYYVQGVEGSSGSATLTASLGGFAGGSATVTVVQPALDLVNLPALTTTMSADAPFMVRIGTPNPGSTYLGTPQAIRAGGTAVTATVTLANSNPGGVALLATSAGLDQSRTVTIPVGQSQSPGAVASGGVAFHPLAAGTITVTAAIPGFITTANGGNINVTVSSPAITFSSPETTVGAGLQSNTALTGVLGALPSGGTTVRIRSSDPSRVLVSPTATTPGTECVDIAVTTRTSFSYYVQGMEGFIGSATLTASANGFTDATCLVSVVQPALDIVNLAGATNSSASDDPFSVRVGIPNALNAAVIEQPIRAGGFSVTATVSLTNVSPPGAALLKTSSGSDQIRTVIISAGQSRSPSAVATGGVALDPSGSGTVTVTAAIPGFITMSAGSVVVTISP